MTDSGHVTQQSIKVVSYTQGDEKATEPTHTRHNNTPEGDTAPLFPSGLLGEAKLGGVLEGEVGPKAEGEAVGDEDADVLGDGEAGEGVVVDFVVEVLIVVVVGKGDDFQVKTGGVVPVGGVLDPRDGVGLAGHVDEEAAAAGLEDVDDDENGGGHLGVEDQRGEADAEGGGDPGHEDGDEVGRRNGGGREPDEGEDDEVEDGGQDEGNGNFRDLFGEEVRFDRVDFGGQFLGEDVALGRERADGLEGRPPRPLRHEKVDDRDDVVGVVAACAVGAADVPPEDAVERRETEHGEPARGFERLAFGGREAAARQRQDLRPKARELRGRRRRDAVVDNDLGAEASARARVLPGQHEPVDVDDFLARVVVIGVVADDLDEVVGRVPLGRHGVADAVEVVRGVHGEAVIDDAALGRQQKQTVEQSPDLGRRLVHAQQDALGHFG
mmetsp:Transcript_28909/g.88399  ORF Transcript_28909/g.88399 Transcript_28909/m.88399 type:complete len:440 (+) Transcript_28909:182-1501(+)